MMNDNVGTKWRKSHTRLLYSQYKSILYIFYCILDSVFVIFIFLWIRMKDNILMSANLWQSNFPMQAFKCKSHRYIIHHFCFYHLLYSFYLEIRFCIHCFQMGIKLKLTLGWEDFYDNTDKNNRKIGILMILFTTYLYIYILFYLRGQFKILKTYITLIHTRPWLLVGG